MNGLIAKLKSVGRRDSGCKLLRRVLSCVLTAAVLSGAAFAWYEQRFDRPGTVQYVLTEDGAGSYATKYTIYRYNADYTDIVKLEPSDVYATQMLKFDSVFTERNAYTALIIVLPVWGTYITHPHPIQVDLNWDDSYALEAAGNPNELAGTLTNIISVRCACLELTDPTAADPTAPVAPDDFATPAELYRAVRTALESQENGVDVYPAQTFIQTHDLPFKDSETGATNWTKQNVSFTVTPPDHEGQEVAYIYLELDYDVALVNAFKQNAITQLIDHLGTNEWNCIFDLSSIILSDPPANSNP